MEKYVSVSSTGLLFDVSEGIESTSTLQLENISDRPVAFKVIKRTVHDYVISPESAILQPEEFILIEFTLQSFQNLSRQLIRDLRYCHDCFALKVEPFETLPAPLTFFHAIYVSMQVERPQDDIPPEFLPITHPVGGHITISSPVAHFDITLGEESRSELLLKNISNQPVVFGLNTLNCNRYFIDSNLPRIFMPHQVAQVTSSIRQRQYTAHLAGSVLHPKQTAKVTIWQRSFAEVPYDLNDCRDYFNLTVSILTRQYLDLLSREQLKGSYRGIHDFDTRLPVTMRLKSAQNNFPWCLLTVTPSFIQMHASKKNSKLVLQNTSDKTVAFHCSFSSDIHFAAEPRAAILRPQQSIQVRISFKGSDAPSHFKNCTNFNNFGDRFLLDVVSCESLLDNFANGVETEEVLMRRSIREYVLERKEISVTIIPRDILQIHAVQRTHLFNRYDVYPVTLEGRYDVFEDIIILDFRKGQTKIRLRNVSERAVSYKARISTFQYSVSPDTGVILPQKDIMLTCTKRYEDVCWEELKHDLLLVDIDQPECECSQNEPCRCNAQPLGEYRIRQQLMILEQKKEISIVEKRGIRALLSLVMSIDFARVSILLFLFWGLFLFFFPDLFLSFVLPSDWKLYASTKR